MNNKFCGEKKSEFLVLELVAGSREQDCYLCFYLGDADLGKPHAFLFDQ